MKKISFVHFVIFMLFLCSCNHPSSPKEVNSNIVVIFQNTPKHETTNRGIGHSTTLPSTIFNFVNEQGELQYYLPKMHGCDTLIIPSHYGYAEVMHRNQSIEDNYYLIEAGDTILFTYTDNLRPQLQSLHSEEKTWLYTIPEHDARLIHKQTGYSIKTLCTSRLYGAMWFALNNPQYRSDKSKQHILNRYRNICPNIDSLQVILSEYQIAQTRYIDSLESCGKISSLYADFYRKGVDRHCIEQILLSDSLLFYPSSHSVIKGLLMSKSSSEIIAFSHDSTIIPKARLSVVDYMLRINKENGSAFSSSIVDALNEAYEQLTGNTFDPEKKHIVTDTQAGSMIITDLEGNTTTFDKLLKEHIGKVIYVDLWASWCAPCLATMPDAEKLRKTYKNKNVVFIYLAVNDNEEAWKRAVEQYHTSTYDGINFIVVNPKEAVFLKEIDNRHIPQYLLYDRSGKLVDANAPKPGTQEIREIINDLME